MGGVAFRDDSKTMPGPYVRIDEKIYVLGGGSVIVAAIL